MDIDPRVNVVVFQLRKGKETQLVGRVPTLAEDGVRQAWDAVGQEHHARAKHVVALHTEWEPTSADAAFISATFPGVTTTHHFPRPEHDGWDHAFAAARVALQAELRPVLWSDSPVVAGRLADVPHWPVAGGRLHLALAVVTAAGTYPVTHEQLADASFDQLMAEACRHLATEFPVEARADAVTVVSARLVAAAACLPAFYQRVSAHLGAERLVVGVLSADLLHVAAEGGTAAGTVERAVREAAAARSSTELVPCLLSVVGDRISVVEPEPTRTIPPLGRSR